MAELKELLEEEELEQVWETSNEKPVYLFKQSTTCPISANAFQQFNSFIEETDEDIAPYFVKVRETRPVSNKIAEETGVQHESPQVFLIKNKEVLWHTSHSDITEETLEEALKENK